MKKKKYTITTKLHGFSPTSTTCALYIALRATFATALARQRPIIRPRTAHIQSGVNRANLILKPSPYHLVQLSRFLQSYARFNASFCDCSRSRSLLPGINSRRRRQNVFFYWSLSSSRCERNPIPRSQVLLCRLTLLCCECLVIITRVERVFGTNQRHSHACTARLRRANVQGAPLQEIWVCKR
jgi:hypothetical protein